MLYIHLKLYMSSDKLLTRARSAARRPTGVRQHEIPDKQEDENTDPAPDLAVLPGSPLFLLFLGMIL
jgi:hypothetical protein